ncbi:MAG: helix-turn-helix transcriptional regulator [Stackebrandtia sp.]
MKPEPLWTPEEVCHYLGVPIDTLYRWRYLGTGPQAAKVGKHLRYDPVDVRAWVKEQKAVAA